LGRVDYRREAHYYDIICQTLTAEPQPAQRDFAQEPENVFELVTEREGAPYTFGSAWTFNTTSSVMIDEYIVDHDDYPAIGAGAFSYLDGGLYTNTFSVDEYVKQIESGHMSVIQKNPLSRPNRMRYRLMMQLFGLELDKAAWEKDFGTSVALGLPAEYSFFKSVGAFEVDDDIRMTLTPKGRYLLVALMREFFIGVNSLRDIARQELPPELRELFFN
jgi:hypothetical protein